MRCWQSLCSALIATDKVLAGDGIGSHRGITRGSQGNIEVVEDTLDVGGQGKRVRTFGGAYTGAADR